MATLPTNAEFLDPIISALTGETNRPEWTTEILTKPGAYWWRETPTSEPYLALVSGDMMGLWIPMFAMGYLPWRELRASYKHCQFAGPLPRPKE